MPLPVTISGATYGKRNSFLGPFKSSGGNFYCVAFDTTASDPAVYKATDPTSSFSEQDSANRPVIKHVGTLGNYTCTVLQSSDILRIITKPDGNATTQGYEYSDFDMGTDLWGKKAASVAGVQTANAASGSARLIRRSDASLVVLFNSTPETIHGTGYDRVVYKTSGDGGTTWSTAVNVGATGVQRHIHGSENILGVSDRCHFFYSDDVTAKHRSLSSTDVLAAEETPTSANAVTASEHNFIPGISYVSGANTVVKTAYRASGSDKLDSIEFNSAATGAAVGTAAFIDNTIFDNGTTDPASVHGCLAVDGTTTHCLYSDHTTQDVFHDQQTDGGSWGTDVERLDAVTVNALSCNIYIRAGSTVLAYVYDDGGTVKYNEVSLGAPPPGAGPPGEDDEFQDESVIPWPLLLGGWLLGKNPPMRRRGLLVGTAVLVGRRLLSLWKGLRGLLLWWI